MIHLLVIDLLVIPGFLIAATAALLALCWRRHGRGSGVETFRSRLKVLFLVLAVGSLCLKAVVDTCRHFNPPPAPIVGP